MTEYEWRSCDNPATLLDAMSASANPRKLRLFALACYRHNSDMFAIDNRFDETAGIADRMADGVVAEEHRHSAEDAAIAAFDEHEFDELDDYLNVPARLVRRDFDLRDAGYVAETLAGHGGRESDLSFDGLEAELVFDHLCFARDILGHPSRPSAIEPAWVTPTVVGLAEGIYAERAFDRLPILADALQDAGCEHVDILSHCRGPGPHVRGCWVVDLLLGKG